MDEKEIAKMFPSKRKTTQFKWKRLGYYIAINAVQMGIGYVVLSTSTLLFPLVISQLGLSAKYANLIFGSLCGIVCFLVQPVIGSMSDNCRSKLGKRKPFIICGALFSCVGLYLVGHSKSIGILLGDPVDQEIVVENTASENGTGEIAVQSTNNEVPLRLYGLMIVLFGSTFCSMGGSFLNISAKALVSDCVPMDEQHPAQFIGVMLSKITDLIYYVSAASMTTLKYFYEIVYGIGMIIVLVTSVITCVFIKEKKFEAKSTCCNRMVGIGKAVIHCPKKLGLLFLIMFVYMMAQGPYLLNLNNFVGENLYHGNSSTNDEIYQRGIQMNMYSLAIASVISSVCSFIFPIICKGKEIAFFIISVLCVTLSMGGYIGLNYFAQTDISSVASVSLLLIFITTITQIAMIGPLSVPWAVFKKVAPFAQLGIYAGLIMSVVMIANVFACIVSGLLVEAFTDLISVFIFQAICLFVSFGVSFVMIYVNKDIGEIDIVSYHTLDDTVEHQQQDTELIRSEDIKANFSDDDDDPIDEERDIPYPQETLVLTETTPLKLNEV